MESQKDRICSIESTKLLHMSKAFKGQNFGSIIEKWKQGQPLRSWQKMTTITASTGLTMPLQIILDWLSIRMQRRQPLKQLNNTASAQLGAHLT